MAKFYIRVEGYVQLDAEDIWPDGDGPTNPTAADVQKVVDDTCGLEGLGGLLKEWNLEDDCDITVEGPNNG